MVGDIQRIALQMDQLKEKIEVNLKTEKNEAGLLLHAPLAYKRCMSVNVEDFKSLLSKDVEDCQKELKQTQIESQKIADNTAKFIAQQQQLLEDFVKMQQ